MRVFVFAAALLLAGCATPPQEPDPPRYWDLPTSHVMPETEGERVAECGRIRDEMARLASLAQIAPPAVGAQPALSGGFRPFNYAQSAGPGFAALLQVKARRGIAKLETRAAEVGCRAAFASADGTTSLRQCFAQCKDLTDRTDEQCFDACR